MIIKPRFEPLELTIFRALSKRMSLPSRESSAYLSLEKGYRGERTFDHFIENLPNEFLILNDLLLESSGTIFQIDSLLISANKIYLIEVKNYEGDYSIEGDRWHSVSGSEIKNPLLQLKRSESLLRRMINDLKFSTSIEAYLLFVNNEFFLYQAPINMQIIFPTQLNRFFSKLKMNSSKLKERHTKLAEQLLSLDINEHQHVRRPSYAFEEIEKGIICGQCDSFDLSLVGRSIVCEQCGNDECVDNAVLRSIEEFKLLFPDRKLTTNDIFEWCKVVRSKKTIRRVLSNNFEYIKQGNFSYYKSTSIEHQNM